MTYFYTRSYRGSVNAVILDWAGTTMEKSRYRLRVVSQCSQPSPRSMPIVIERGRVELTVGSTREHIY